MTQVLKNIWQIYIATLLLLPLYSFAAPNIYFRDRDLTKYPANICVDSNFFFPYTFVYKNKPVGIHTDFIVKAFEKIGYKTKFLPRTLSDCLAGAENGMYDAILSISYSDDRAEFLNYPEDANSDPVSQWRLSQISYIVVTTRKQNGKYITIDEQLDKIPEPIRVETGSSIKSIFNARKKILSHENCIENIQQLLESNSGCVITNHESATALLRKIPNSSKLKIHKHVIAAKSYFMPFARNSDISRKNQRKIWEEIRKLREDKKFTDTLLAKYGY